MDPDDAEAWGRCSRIEERTTPIIVVGDRDPGLTAEEIDRLKETLNRPSSIIRFADQTMQAWLANPFRRYTPRPDIFTPDIFKTNIVTDHGYHPAKPHRPYGGTSIRKVAKELVERARANQERTERPVFEFQFPRQVALRAAMGAFTVALL